MTQYEQAIELVLYLLNLDIDINTAADAAERRYQTPKQILINLFNLENV